MQEYGSKDTHDPSQVGDVLGLSFNLIFPNCNLILNDLLV